MKRLFPFLQLHSAFPVDSLRVRWVPLVRSFHRLGAFAFSPHPGVHGFPVRRREVGGQASEYRRHQPPPPEPDRTLSVSSGSPGVLAGMQVFASLFGLMTSPSQPTPMSDRLPAGLPHVLPITGRQYEYYARSVTLSLTERR